MKRWAHIGVLIVISVVLPAYAQEDSSFVTVLRSDGLLLWEDASTMIMLPFHFDRDQWLATGGVAAGTVILFPLDKPVREFTGRNVSPTNDMLADVGREYGREFYGLSLAGGLYTGGLIFGDQGVRLTGLMLFESIGFAGATTIALKGILGRSRRFLEEGQYRFRGFQSAFERTSMPSGHATVAFAVSSLLAARIGHPAATVALYTIAGLTAMSRVYDDEHWISDTFLGAAIGTASGLTVARLHDREQGAGASFNLIPYPGGLRAEYRF